MIKQAVENVFHRDNSSVTVAELEFDQGVLSLAEKGASLSVDTYTKFAFSALRPQSVGVISGEWISNLDVNHDHRRFFIDTSNPYTTTTGTVLLKRGKSLLLAKTQKHHINPSHVIGRVVYSELLAA